MKMTRNAGSLKVGAIRHIILGVFVVVISATLLTILTAILVNNEVINMKALPVAMIAIHMVSSFLGTFVAASVEKGRIIITSAIVCACYFAILICANMIFYSSGFDGLLTGIISILVGGALAIPVKMKIGGAKKVHVKMRHR